jgi:hypothetical protein
MPATGPPIPPSIRCDVAELIWLQRNHIAYGEGVSFPHYASVKPHLGRASAERAWLRLIVSLRRYEVPHDKWNGHADYNETPNNTFVRICMSSLEFDELIHERELEKILGTDTAIPARDSPLLPSRVEAHKEARRSVCLSRRATVPV